MTEETTNGEYGDGGEEVAEEVAEPFHRTMAEADPSMHRIAPQEGVHDSAIQAPTPGADDQHIGEVSDDDPFAR